MKKKSFDEVFSKKITWKMPFAILLFPISVGGLFLGDLESIDFPGIILKSDGEHLLLIINEKSKWIDFNVNKGHATLK